MRRTGLDVNKTVLQSAKPNRPVIGERSGSLLATYIATNSLILNYESEFVKHLSSCGKLSCLNDIRT